MGMPKWALLVMGTGKVRICHLSAHPQTEPVRGPPLHVAACLALALLGNAAGQEAALLEGSVRPDPDLLVVAASREVALVEAAMLAVAPSPWELQERSELSPAPFQRALLELLLGSVISNVADFPTARLRDPKLCQKPAPIPHYVVVFQLVAVVAPRNAELHPGLDLRLIKLQDPPQLLDAKL